MRCDCPIAGDYTKPALRNPDAIFTFDLARGLH